MAGEDSVDADIKVLQSQYQLLVDQNKVINGKLDSILDKWEAIARLQEQVSQQSSALTHAFRQIERFRIDHGDDFKELRDDHDEDVESIWKSIRTVDQEHRKWTNRILGGAAVATVLMAALQWFSLKQIDKVDQNNKAITVMERRIYALEDKLERGESQ